MTKNNFAVIFLEYPFMNELSEANKLAQISYWNKCRMTLDDIRTRLNASNAIKTMLANKFNETTWHLIQTLYNPSLM